METLLAPSGNRVLDKPHRKAGQGRSIGMTEKAKVGGNAPDKPTSVWSILAREIAEPSRQKESK